MQYALEYKFEDAYTSAYSCRMDISYRLDEAMKYAGIESQSELARKSGVPQPTINRILKRVGKKGPEADTVRKLAIACNVSFDWLNEGVGPKQRPAVEQPSQFEKNAHWVPAGGRKIPVISAVQAGKLKEISDPYPPGVGFDVEYIDADDPASPWTYALEIEGDSMFPEFREGDRVIIDPDLTPNPGDFVVARNHSEEATFKKYRPRGADASGNQIFELVPLNDDYATLRSDTDHLVILGVMIEHRKKYRRRKKQDK